MFSDRGKSICLDFRCIRMIKSSLLQCVFTMFLESKVLLLFAFELQKRILMPLDAGDIVSPRMEAVTNVVNERNVAIKVDLLHQTY